MEHYRKYFVSINQWHFNSRSLILDKEKPDHNLTFLIKKISFKILAKIGTWNLWIFFGQNFASKYQLL